MLIAAKSKLVVIGDSITDAERFLKIEELETNELGYGYVSFVAALLGAVYPDRKINIVNRGISGNTVRDLKQR